MESTQIGTNYAAYQMIFEDDHEEQMSDRFEFSEPKVEVLFDDDSMDSLRNFRQEGTQFIISQLETIFEKDGMSITVPQF
jgi:Fe-S cluster assembly iron-binding protein IscA